MEGGNTDEYANLVRQSDEYGNPLIPQTTINMDAGRPGLSTNVGHATGGAGCHYDFGDTTGLGFGAAAAAYINQRASDDEHPAGVNRRKADHKDDEAGTEIKKTTTTTTTTDGGGARKENLAN